MKLSKSIFAVAGAAVVAVAIAACGSSSGGGSSSAASDCPLGAADTSITTVARIAYQKIPNGDLIVKDQQILEKCMPNAKISWSVFASGGDVLQAYGAKAVDMGLTGSNPNVKALSAPLNTTLPAIQTVWIHDVIGAGESLIVHPEIKSAADLKGKKIATPFGSTSHYSLLNWLSANGLTTTDVEVINLEPEKMLAAWGEIAGAWVWDPTLSELVKGGGVALASSADTAAAGKPTYDLGNATKEFVDANGPFMTMWAKAENYAVSMILDKPADAAASMAAELALPAADVQKMFAGYTYLPAAEQASDKWLGGALGTQFLDTAKFLLEQGSIEGVSAPEVYSAGINKGPAESAAK
ncbi:unannotated protein [freshwater metagenome]|uniref:Unannotated protein n=1 Tax=freshwater metagenome TaxID=449393 RepID=A0A6J7GES6_9ZZZZ|nr:glycine/betaine ABC transporter substrate-binding protein [Actinomycetota bacterium]